MVAPGHHQAAVAAATGKAAMAETRQHLTLVDPLKPSLAH
jgi:hypothetical protein